MRDRNEATKSSTAEHLRQALSRSELSPSLSATSSVLNAFGRSCLLAITSSTQFFSSLAHPQLGIVATRLGTLAFSPDRCCLPRRSAHLCSGSSDATVVAVGSV